MTDKNRKPLEGHRRRGKVFSPPLTQLDVISEVRWIDDLLPEFLWIGFLINEAGVSRALRILETIVESEPRLTSDGKSWLARASTFSELASHGAADLIHALRNAQQLDRFHTAVGPLVAHYPECPLMCLFVETEPAGEISAVRDNVSRMLDRWSDHASWVQIAAVYTFIGQGRLHFGPDSVLAEFPEVEHYPKTQKSRAIASACRALINSFPASDEPEASRRWSSYFWARGLELDPCVPISVEEDNE